MSSPATRNLGWAKRIGGVVVLWAFICGLALLGNMHPRPLLLAALSVGLSVAYWMVSDTFALAEPTDWQVSGEFVSRPRGADSRVVALERLIVNCPDSASARQRLRHLLSELAIEQLLSRRGIDRQSDPDGARAALGADLDDFITCTDPDPKALHTDRMSLLLNRIESL